MAAPLDIQMKVPAGMVVPRELADWFLAIKVSPLVVLRTLLPDVPVMTIFRGVLFFIAADMVRTGILIFAPANSLPLPRLM